MTTFMFRWQEFIFNHTLDFDRFQKGCESRDLETFLIQEGVEGKWPEYFRYYSPKFEADSSEEAFQILIQGLKEDIWPETLDPVTLPDDEVMPTPDLYRRGMYRDFAILWTREEKISQEHLEKVILHPKEAEIEAIANLLDGINNEEARTAAHRLRSLL